MGGSSHVRSALALFRIELNVLFESGGPQQCHSTVLFSGAVSRKGAFVRLELSVCLDCCFSLRVLDSLAICSGHCTMLGVTGSIRSICLVQSSFVGRFRIHLADAVTLAGRLGTK